MHQLRVNINVILFNGDFHRRIIMGMIHSLIICLINHKDELNPHYLFTLYFFSGH